MGSLTESQMLEEIYGWNLPVAIFMAFAVIVGNIAILIGKWVL